MVNNYFKFVYPLRKFCPKLPSTSRSSMIFPYTPLQMGKISTIYMRTISFRLNHEWTWTWTWSWSWSWSFCISEGNQAETKYKSRLNFCRLLMLGLSIMRNYGPWLISLSSDLKLKFALTSAYNLDSSIL